MSLSALWRGPWGDAYSRRNLRVGAARGPFWNRLLHSFPAASVLEVGANAGANLVHIEALVPCIVGVDVNESALAAAASRLGRETRLYLMDVTDLRFADGQFELVFSCGVLIHIADADLPITLDEMYRVSSKYLMVMEYHAPVETEVPYRGQRGVLHKRPYDLIVSKRFGQKLLLHGQGWLGRADGFDSVNWWIWRKA